MKNKDFDQRIIVRSNYGDSKCNKLQNTAEPAMKITIAAINWRQYSAWVGGSILSTFLASQQKWISKSMMNLVQALSIASAQ